jgi:hypothetical protein
MANMRVSGEMKSRELEIKRCYFPGIKISMDCDDCGKSMERDLGDDYESHPMVGVPMEFNFYCQSCDHESFGKGQIDIVIKAL